LQKRRRIFSRIEQAQRRASDQIPPAGRTQRINSRLCAADSDRTGRNFFPWYIPPWSSQLLRKTCQKWESGNKSYAGDAILSHAVKTDNFLRRDIRASRNIIDIQCEFRIIADWNFDQARTGPCSSAAPAAVSARGYSSMNSLDKPIEHLAWCFSRFGHGDRIKENRDARIRRRELDDTGNLRALKLLKGAEDSVQCFLGSILESVAHTKDQRGIAEGNNFH